MTINPSMEKVAEELSRAAGASIRKILKDAGYSDEEIVITVRAALDDIIVAGVRYGDTQGRPKKEPDYDDWGGGLTFSEHASLRDKD